MIQPASLVAPMSWAAWANTITPLWKVPTSAVRKSGYR